VPFDYRELIYREILSVSPEDPFYYYKKFSKMLLILSDDDQEHLVASMDDVKTSFGLSGYSLFNIEKFLNGSKGLKIRSEGDITRVNCEQVTDRLRLIDEWVDQKLRELVKQIRFSNMSEIAQLRQQSV